MSFVTEVCGDSAPAEPCAASGATEKPAAATTAHHRARLVIQTSVEVAPGSAAPRGCDARCGHDTLGIGRDGAAETPSLRSGTWSSCSYYAEPRRASSTPQESAFGPSPEVKRIVRGAPARCACTIL